MPTSTVRHPIGRAVSAFLDAPPSYRADDILIGTLSFQAIGQELTGMNSASPASTTYPGANAVIVYPFQTCEPYLVYKVWWINGTTATTDNADVGIYNEAGTTLLVSGGSTAIATANRVQEKDCTDTLIPPGRYWMAYNQSGVTATPMCITTLTSFSRICGTAAFTGAVPLGSTFTPVANGNVVPIFGVAARTQVA